MLFKRHYKMFQLGIQLEILAFDLKKLQTPLYEEFINSLSAIPEVIDSNLIHEHGTGITNAPRKNSEPSSSSKIANDSFMISSVNASTVIPRVPNNEEESNPVLQEIPSIQLNEWGDFLQDSQLGANNPRHKKWKKELVLELERQ